MAIKWGSWTYISGAGFDFRTGTELSYSPTTITTSTSSVTVTTKVYLQVEPGYTAYGSNARYEVTGDESGSAEGISWNIPTSGGSDLIATLTETVALNYGSSQTFDTSARIRPSFTWGTYTAWVSNSISIPARPYAAPNAPTGLSVSRSSDTRQNLSWTNNPVTPNKPYRNVEVWRRELNGATNTWTTFARIQNLSGSSTSYADTTTVANRKYEYKVRATNTGGSSGYSNTVSISTTPSTPNAPAVSKSSAGVVTITKPTSVSAIATHWELWHAAQVGGVWTWDAARLAELTVATASHAYTPDPSTPHKYGVKARSTTPSLYSARSADSSIVQLLTPPAAPTILTPASLAAFDATGALVVSWNHNSIDLTPQTAYEVTWSFDGGTTWAAGSGKVTSTATSRTIAANTFTNGTEPVIRVRTWGSHATASPWTEVVVRASARPVAGISGPDPYPGPVFALPVTFFDPEGLPMSAWRAELWRNDELVDSRSGTGQLYNLLFPNTRLEDASTYETRFWASDSVGLESDVATETLNVVYALPAVPTLGVEWDPDAGVTHLTPHGGVGGAVATDTLTIVRQEGDEWVIVAEGVVNHSTVTDYTPPLGRTVVYRAVAVSALPSTRPSIDYPVETTTELAFINYGPGFSNIVRLSSNVLAESSVGRNRERHVFSRDEDYTRDHRGASVTYSGMATLREHVITASLWGPWTSAEDDQSTWAELDALGGSDGLVCVRDPLGTYLIGSVGRILRSGHGDDEVKVTIPLWEDETPYPTMVTL